MVLSGPVTGLMKIAGAQNKTPVIKLILPTNKRRPESSKRGCSQKGRTNRTLPISKMITTVEPNKGYFPNLEPLTTAPQPTKHTYKSPKEWIIKKHDILPPILNMVL